MNEHDIINAIGTIDEELIINAEKIRKKKKSFPFYKLTAVAASAFLCFGCVYMAYHFASLKDITKYEGSIQGADTHYETGDSIQETDTHCEEDEGISTESVNEITYNTESDKSTEKEPEKNDGDEIISIETDAIEVTDIITLPLPPAQEDTVTPPAVLPPSATGTPPPGIELPEVKITVTKTFENGIFATVKDGMTSYLKADEEVIIKFEPVIWFSVPVEEDRWINKTMPFDESLFNIGDTFIVQFSSFEDNKDKDTLYSDTVILLQGENNEKQYF